jgi:hypothetical protein
VAVSEEVCEDMGPYHPTSASEEDVHFGVPVCRYINRHLIKDDSIEDQEELLIDVQAYKNT